MDPTSSHNPDAIARRRADEIRNRLAAAAQFLQHGAIDSAIEACEAALIIEPDNADALRLLDQVHHFDLQRSVQDWIADAAVRLSRDDLAGARALIARVRAAQPDLPEALRLESLVLERERSRAVQRYVSEAFGSLDRGAPDAALKAADAAIALDALNRDAHEARRLAFEALNAAELRGDRDRHALVEIDQARAEAASGDLDAALKRLRRFPGLHPLVEKTARELTLQLIEQQEQAVAAAARSAPTRVDLRPADTLRAPAAQPAPAKGAAPAPRRHSRALIAYAVVVTLIAIGGGLWFVTGGSLRPVAPNGARVDMNVTAPAAASPSVEAASAAATPEASVTAAPAVAPPPVPLKPVVRRRVVTPDPEAAAAAVANEPAPEPAPPVDPGPTDEQKIQAVLARYTQAYASLNADAVARVVPLDAAQLRTLSGRFKQLSAFNVRFDRQQPILFTSDTANASVVCDVTITQVAQDGDQSRPVSARRVFEFERVDQDWRIVRVR